MSRFRRWMLALMLGAGTLGMAPPALGQDAPPENPPGVVSATGTWFVVDLGDSVHFTVASSETVAATIQAFSKKRLRIQVVTTGAAGSTQVTVAGFPAGETLHMAVDDLRSDREFSTDAAGTHTFSLDLSSPHVVVIKPSASTWYLDENGWSEDRDAPGTWDPVTRTATLTQDLDETLQITGSDITLDGAGHTIDALDNWVGIYIGQATDVTVRNLTVSGMENAVLIYASARILLQDMTVRDPYGWQMDAITASGPADGQCSDLTLRNLTLLDDMHAWFAGVRTSQVQRVRIEGMNISDTDSPIALGGGSDHVVRNVVALNIQMGLRFMSVNRPRIFENQVRSVVVGIYLANTRDARIHDNDVTAESHALLMVGGARDTIYHNNFVSLTGLGPLLPAAYPSSGHVFHLPAPIGGNYWSTWCPPDHPDADTDGFVDQPYALSASYADNLPYAAPGGWRAQRPPLAIEAPADAGYACASTVPAASPDQALVTGGTGTPSVTIEETTNQGTGSPASPLIVTRTWTAADEAGQTASDSQTITVVDAAPPSLSTPADVVAVTGPGIEPCSEVRIPLEIGAATAMDECGSVVVSVSGVPDEGRYPVGVTILTWTATDAAGNTVSAPQSITVTCPVGTITGAASRTCDGVTDPADAAIVRLLHEGIAFREAETGAEGGYAFADLRHGTYTVQIVPPTGFGVPIDTRTMTLAVDRLELETFAFTCLLGDVAGRVEGACTGVPVGLQGVTVDLYRQNGEGVDVLVATAGTDGAGDFRFDNLALGDYRLSILTPLGYAATEPSRPVSLSVPDAPVEVPAFGLTCRQIVNQVRGIGYWKHQVNVYLTGKGTAQESLDQMLGYIDAMVEHFNQNLVNPVIVYVPAGGATQDRLLELQQLMTVNRGGTTLDRAKQQLLPLLLNVVSGKIGQTEVISDNGTNVSQAITYCHELIVDGVPDNDDLARSIAEAINEGRRVAAGAVPVSTRQITYSIRPVPSEPPALALERLSPNPARNAFTVTFALTGRGAASLEILDVTGRQVLRRDLSGLGAGHHALATGGLCAPAAGVYFVRLSENGRSVTGRLALVR